MTHPTSILLFAAGFGTRMAPLTDTKPKPLVTVASRALIDHALAFCDGLQVVVNTHYFADQIHDHVAGQGILISHEDTAPLETGGGLKKALPLLGPDPVFTMNTDAVWRGSNPVTDLIKAWDLTMDALLLMIPKDHAIGHTGAGDFDITESGHLQRGTDFVFSGVQIIRTDRLADISEDRFSMWSLWTGMLKTKSMFGVPYTGQWCDVGRPDSIRLAEAMLKDGSDV